MIWEARDILRLNVLRVGLSSPNGYQMRFSSSASSSHSLYLILGGQNFLSLTLVSALLANFLFASLHDKQRCVEILTLCVTAVVVLIRVAKGRGPVLPKPVGMLLLAFVTFGLVSLLTAPSLQHAVNEWSSILLLLVLVFSLAEEMTQVGYCLQTLVHLAGIACGLYSLRVLLMYVMALVSGFQVDMHELAVGFSNARFLNHTQTALLPLIILLCLKAPKQSTWRKTWFALAVFWWALLFVCEARASVVALVAACICAVGLRRSHARPFMLTMLWSALAGLVLYALLFILLPVLVGLQPVGSPLNVVARTAADPTSSRNLLWKLALDLITAHPWLGVGPQHFAHEGARLYTGAHPHNWILQIGAEWGIPALLCLLGAAFLGGRALVRSGAKLVATDVENQHMLVTLQVACAAIFVDGLLSGVIVMPQSQLAIALVLGVACAWVRGQDGALESAHVEPSLVNRIVVISLVVAGSAGLIWSVAPDIVRHAHGEPLTPAELAANPEAHWSRMWEAGYF